MHVHMGAERGSIPVVLLTSIIVGGLIVVLVAAVLVNQRTARFDRSFTTVFQESDEYVQEVSNYFIREQWDIGRDDAVGTTYPNATDTLDTLGAANACPAVADGDVCVTAIKVSPLRYEVEATAVQRTSGDEVATRTVAADVVDLPRFFLAAFADTEIALRGGNGATSYGNGAWYTGHGIIGTNEEIVLNGSSTDIDGVQLHNWDNYPDLDRCTHSGGNDCDDVRADPPVPPSDRLGPRLEVGGPRLNTTFIDEALASCGTPLESYTSSTDGATLTGNGSFICVDNLTFDTDVTVLNGPVEIYVAGQISISNDVSINCPAGGCAIGSGDPDSTALRIYSSGGDVSLGNHSEIVAGIYAPESDCAGNPSNAQGAIYGSMICRTIDNQGGWQFNYDDDLQTVGSHTWQLDNYREE